MRKTESIWFVSSRKVFMALNRHQGNGTIKFHLFMLSQGYRRSDIDHCLYTKRAKDGSVLIFILYVDDMLLASTNINELATLKSKLNDTFDMKDLGDASHIFGMCIVRDRDKKLLYLSQAEYIDKVLKRFNMERGRHRVLHCLHI